MSTKRFVSIIITAIMVFVAVVASVAFATAEEQHGTVIIVYFDNQETYVVEYNNGESDYYTFRGDLVPGDEVSIDGDEVKLVSQSNWDYVSRYKEGEEVAWYLYTRDLIKDIEEQP